MTASAGPHQPLQPATKSPRAFRTIAEVAEELHLPQHVLRFWETKFAQVRPLKRRGGRRYYRPEDVVLLKRIRALLYGDGYTIRGVQKLLREEGTKGLPGRAPAPAAGTEPSDSPQQVMFAHRHPPPPPMRAVCDVEGGVSLSAQARDELRAVLASLEAIRALLTPPGS